MLGNVAIVGAALGAAWFDLRERRIPNLLTLGALVLALLLRVPYGVDEVAVGLAGAAIGLAVGLAFFLLGGMGGGDVKLLAAVGAFLGPGRIWLGLFVTALVGGAMAVGAIVRRRAVRQTMANLHTIVSRFGVRSFTGWKGKGSASPVTLDTPGVITVPYGVAIAAGALAAWFL